MTHQIACLLHLLAAHKTPVNVSRFVDALFTDIAIDEAARRGFVDHPGVDRVALDRYWLQLTERGRELVSDALVSMEVAA